MAQLFGVLLLFLVSSGGALHVQESSLKGDQQLRKIPLTRTLRIPLIRTLDPLGATGPSRPDSAAMAVWPGAMDEPPEGPSGFDVFEDGNLVVTDPLSRRLALYDPQGTFRRSWHLEFASDSVTVTHDGLMLVREANTGQTHLFDQEGKPRSAGAHELPVLPPARILSGKSGTISTSVPMGASIAVRFEEPGSALLSLESLAIDPNRGIFVAMETTAPEGGADAISLRKTVRRYSLAGALLAETSAIPLDYYVLPIDELRVRKGVVYQLMTTRSEVRINEWNIN